jgi:hypothetical protein
LNLSPLKVLTDFFVLELLVFSKIFCILGYECLLGALEMGFNVDGFLVIDEKTLINPWNFKGWH